MFCPICRNECSKDCGLYDDLGNRCSLLTIARGCDRIDADSITTALNDMQEAIIEVSKSINSSF